MRPPRVQYAGAVYHITTRGNAKQAIFLDPHDRTMFLNTLGESVDRYAWHCHAYCLMGNHYHLLVETREPTLSKGMRHLNGVYTQRFNRRHDRVGHLFQGRFKAIIVEKEPHLLEVARYVVLNPVRAGAVTAPAQWRWSSYRATAGHDRPQPFLTTHWLLSQFADDLSVARRAYIRFVSQRSVTCPWEQLRDQRFLGSDAFVERMTGSRPCSPETPPHHQDTSRPPLAALLEDGCDDEAIVHAHRHHGYTMKEIGDHLGLHHTTVSRRIHRWEGEPGS